jgi:hypothetical protein
MAIGRLMHWRSEITQDPCESLRRANRTEGPSHQGAGLRPGGVLLGDFGCCFGSRPLSQSWEKVGFSGSQVLLLYNSTVGH